MKKNKNDKINIAKEKLKQIANNWPKPNGEFVFFLEDDHLWLHKIRLPESHRGDGTKRLAEILSITDQAGLLVCLTADPIFKEDGELCNKNPETYHLVKWYMRFGFTPYGHTEDGFIMDRQPKFNSSPERILKQYNDNKQNDISYEEYRRKWEEPKFKI